MQTTILILTTYIIVFPLLGAIIAGLCGKMIGKKATHSITIAFVGISFLLSCYLFKRIVIDNVAPVNATIYTWGAGAHFNFQIGWLVDRLSVTMAVIVSFVSWMVHIYTIGYMSGDPGYQRFFSYVSLFTFAMLTLVLANNFLLLFFGWEGVGLVSYLLIGFWFNRESAVFGSLKAFLVNRVGDFAFILGIAAIFTYYGTLDYAQVFSSAGSVVGKTMSFAHSYPIPVIDIMCLLLFIGAMAKSAQVPLHVWLPESMEGPTPISALIHAATMVTAGIFMVARASPLFELSQPMLSLILVIGATTAFFMGILAVFHFDIKRVIAYSTISQLGYMAMALGASAYDAAIFHLITHAFFKALLFLAAGSVIIAFHHKVQDMRKMGALSDYMPITNITFLMGALALAAIPPFAGFYSKDTIIEAVHLSTIPGAKYAYFCALTGAFITPLYIFRAYFLTFHGDSRIDPEYKNHIHESPWVVLIPLLALAVPSVIAGGMLIGPMLYAQPTVLANSVFVLPQHNVLLEMAQHFSGAKAMAYHATQTLTFWLAFLGIVTAWFFSLGYPQVAVRLKQRFALAYDIIQRKYGFDDFNQLVIVHGVQRLGKFLYQVTDLKIIDGIVNGSGAIIRWFADRSKRVQTGYLYDYAFVMIAGLAAFLVWILARYPGVS